MPLTRAQDAAALKYIVETVLNQSVDEPIMKSLTNDGFDYVSDLSSLRDVDILNMKYSADDGTLLALSFALRGRLTAFCALMRYRGIQSLPIGDNWTSITREEFEKFRISPVYDGTIYGMISTSNLNIPATPFVSTMPLTRTQDAAALRHIVVQVLNQPDDGLLMTALTQKHIDNVNDLTSLQEIDIQSLKYSAADGNLSALGAAHCGMLRAFCAFVRYRATQSSPIGDDWTSITRDDFNQFRCSRYFDGTIGKASVSNPGIPAAPSNRARDPIPNFERGIKRDISDPKATIQRLVTLGGETFTPIIKSLHVSNETGIDSNDGETKEYQHMPIAGKALLIDPQEDGQHCRVRIVRAIEDRDGETADTPTRTELLCSINDDASEEIEILSHIESDESEETSVLKFKRITAHEGPLIRTSPDWKGSSYNVTIEWENGKSTSESLTVIAATDPIICAIYAQDNDLLEVAGWKRFKAISSRQSKLLRTVNQAKLHSYHTAPKYHHGDGVPKDYQHAIRLDERAENTKWQDSTKQKMFQFGDYDAFNDYGHSGRPPGKYKIRVHRFNSGTLVDRGANGGVAGADVRVIFLTGRHVDILGIDDHHIVDIPIVTAGGVMDTTRGPVVAIMHQYAYTGKGATIHSCGQLEWYKNDVNDRSIKVPGGLQRIQTNDGYVIPISIQDGLPYVKMRPYTDEEWDTLPHVILTSDVNWDPAALDDTIDDDAKNPRLDPLGGETSTPITKSRHDSNESGINSNDGETKEYHHMPGFHASDLVGKALVMDPKKDFYHFRDDRLPQPIIPPATLIDRDANNGFAGADARHVVDRGIRWPFHRAREAIATKIIVFYHDAFEDIAADFVAFYHDTLSILWDYQQVWKLLRPPVF
jgi:hypothetical protein